jgi:hypothetical protein
MHPQACERDGGAQFKELRVLLSGESNCVSEFGRYFEVT